MSYIIEMSVSPYPSSVTAYIEPKDIQNYSYGIDVTKGLFSEMKIERWVFRRALRESNLDGGLVFTRKDWDWLTLHAWSDVIGSLNREIDRLQIKVSEQLTEYKKWKQYAYVMQKLKAPETGGEDS